MALITLTEKTYVEGIWTADSNDLMANFMAILFKEDDEADWTLICRFKYYKDKTDSAKYEKSFYRFSKANSAKEEPTYLLSLAKKIIAEQFKSFEFIEIKGDGNLFLEKVKNCENFVVSDQDTASY